MDGMRKRMYVDEGDEKKKVYERYVCG